MIINYQELETKLRERSLVKYSRKEQRRAEKLRDWDRNQQRKLVQNVKRSWDINW